MCWSTLAFAIFVIGVAAHDVPEREANSLTPCCDDNATVSVTDTELCRNRLAHLPIGDVIASQKLSNLPCYLWCDVTIYWPFRVVIPKMVFVKDFTPCGDDKICSKGRCVENVTEIEFRRCQATFEGSEVQVIPGGILPECQMYCRKEGFPAFLNSRIMFRRDGTPCEYGLFREGICYYGKCVKV